MALADVMSITKWSIAFIACCGKGGIPFRPAGAGRSPPPAGCGVVRFRPLIRSDQSPTGRGLVWGREQTGSLVALFRPGCGRAPLPQALQRRLRFGREQFGRRLGAAAVSWLQIRKTRVHVLDAAADPGSVPSVFAPGSCASTGAASSAASAAVDSISAFTRVFDALWPGSGAAVVAREDGSGISVSLAFGWRSFRSTAAASCVERYAGVSAGALRSSAYEAGASAPTSVARLVMMVLLGREVSQF